MTDDPPVHVTRAALSHHAVRACLWDPHALAQSRDGRGDPLAWDLALLCPVLERVHHRSPVLQTVPPEVTAPITSPS